MITNETFKERTSLSLEDKIEWSKQRVKEWCEAWDGNVYVAFSGGLDSTVMLDIVRSVYSDVPGVFANTGLEFPEIKTFVKGFENIAWVRPTKPFHKVIQDHGYPVVSKSVSYKIQMLQNPTNKNAVSRHLYLTGFKKNGQENKNFKLPKKWECLIDAPFNVSDKCCKYLKKQPLENYEKETGRSPIIGVRADESNRRVIDYRKTGCNNFHGSQVSSKPMSIWSREDIIQYINEYNLSYASIYDKGWDRTGCIFCLFGVHLEKEPNRFQKLKDTHPEKYDYCINKLGCGNVLNYIGVKY